MSAPSSTAPADRVERIRTALYRREVAAARHRTAMARALMLSDSEALAVGHLAQHGELTQSHLGALLNLSSGGTAALVQRLEAAGHACRRDGEEDKRLRFVSLSAQTRERAARFSRPLDADLDAILERAGAGGEAVIRCLDEIASVTEVHADRATDRKGSAAAGAAVRPGLWG